MKKLNFLCAHLTSEVGYMAHRQKMLHTPALDVIVPVRRIKRLCNDFVYDSTVNFSFF